MAYPVADAYSCLSGGTIAGGRSLLPVWHPAITPTTWGLVATNQLTDVDPAKVPALNPLVYPASPWRSVADQNAVINAYSGGEWDEPKKRLHIWGGGHDDYAGNEKYIWDAATGLFVRQNNPTGCTGNDAGDIHLDGGELSARYFDGQPRSFHTYSNFAMRNGVLWFFCGSPHKAGFTAGRPFRWNDTTNLWDMDADVDIHVNLGYGGSCYDSIRDQFLIVASGNGQPAMYDPITKTLNYKAGWTGWSGGVAKVKHNALRDCYVVLSNGLWIMSGGAGSDGVLATVTGTPPTYANSIGPGLEYDEARDIYYVWTTGATIYTLTPPAVGQNPKTATWTWGTLPLSGSNAVTPARSAWGSQGRFWYSPSLGCCGVVNSVTQYMHVYKMSS